MNFGFVKWQTNQVIKQQSICFYAVLKKKTELQDENKC